MDTQLNNYQVLENGKPLADMTGTLEQVIKMVRFLEAFLDRATQHSPFTIGKRDFSNGS